MQDLTLTLTVILTLNEQIAWEENEQKKLAARVQHEYTEENNEEEDEKAKEARERIERMKAKANAEK